MYTFCILIYLHLLWVCWCQHVFSKGKAFFFEHVCTCTQLCMTYTATHVHTAIQTQLCISRLIRFLSPRMTQEIAQNICEVHPAQPHSRARCSPTILFTICVRQLCYSGTGWLPAVPLRHPWGDTGHRVTTESSCWKSREVTVQHLWPLHCHTIVWRFEVWVVGRSFFYVG